MQLKPTKPSTNENLDLSLDTCPQENIDDAVFLRVKVNMEMSKQAIEDNASYLTAQVDKVSTKLNNKTLPVVSKVRAVHRVVDKIIKAGRLKEISVCKKGCNHCCSVSVDLSGAEAQNIAARYNLTPSPVRGIRDNQGRSQPLCPFNQDSQCQIYPDRPIACRSFFSMDSVEPCIKGEQHIIFTEQSNDTLLQLHAGLVMLDPRSADIRQFFPNGLKK